MDNKTLRDHTAVKRMVASGMTQSQIAKALDISQPTVSRLLHFEPDKVSGSLAEMVATNAKRRALRDQLYEAYHAGENTSDIERELAAL